MSAVLGAGRSAAKKLSGRDKPKSAKKKISKTKPSEGRPIPPPPSSTKTKVWNWVDMRTEKEYTLMLSLDTFKVWCNGDNLPCEDGFDEDCNGPVKTFFILDDDEEMAHEGKIKGHRPVGCKQLMFHLYVNDDLVLEHTGAEEMMCPPGAPPAYSPAEPPPPYSHCEEQDSKKHK